MRLAVWFERETWRLSRPIWVLIVTTFAAVALMLSTAWASPGALVLFVLAPATALLLCKKDFQTQPITPLLVVAIICWLYTASSALWSPYAMWTLKAALLAGVLIVALHLSFVVHNSLPTEWLEHMTRAALVAFIVFLIFSLIEEGFSHPIKRVLFWPFRAYRFEDGWVTFNWQHQTEIRPSRTNWSITNISLMLWPILLIAKTQLQRMDQKWFMLVTFIVAFAVAFLSAHETSKVALVVGFLAYIVAKRYCKQTIFVFAIAWLVAIAAVVPVAQMMIDNKLHLSSEIPRSLRQRFVMWNYIADKLPERPILGIGARATKPLDREHKGKYGWIKGTKLQVRTGPHPHNIYLQTYYELGVVGAMLLLILGWTILWSIHNLPREMRRFYLATFATAAVTSATGFGLFEPWYACAQVMAVITLHLGATYLGRLGSRNT